MALAVPNAATAMSSQPIVLRGRRITSATPTAANGTSVMTEKLSAPAIRQRTVPMTSSPTSTTLGPTPRDVSGTAELGLPAVIGFRLGYVASVHPRRSRVSLVAHPEIIAQRCSEIVTELGDTGRQGNGALNGAPYEAPRPLRQSLHHR